MSVLFPRRVLLALSALLGPLGASWGADPLLDRAEAVAFAFGSWHRTPRHAAESSLPPCEPDCNRGTELTEQELHEELGENPKQQVESPEPTPSTSPTRPSSTRRSRAPASSKPPSTEAPRRGIRVDARTVLELARRRIIPEGTPVAATKEHPGGMRLHGVSRMGVGLRDGDILTHVAGTAVTDRNQVVQAVLQTRARRAPRVTGRFVRNGEPWLLVVELPYLDQKATPENPKAPAVTKPKLRTRAAQPRR